MLKPQPGAHPGQGLPAPLGGLFPLSLVGEEISVIATGSAPFSLCNRREAGQTEAVRPGFGGERRVAIGTAGIG